MYWSILLRVTRVAKEGWLHRCTELAGDSVRRGVYHPHFGVSFGVDAAAFKMQAASDMHVLRSPYYSKYAHAFEGMSGGRIVDAHIMSKSTPGHWLVFS
jgi:hypothetical protein